MKLISKSKTDTKKLAEKIAKHLRGGEVIGLIGELGTGKTTFIQYLAKTLGVKTTVNSPTFNIMKLYKTHHPFIKYLCHIDAYRLTSVNELLALGPQEYFNKKDTVTVIEWANKVKKILPPKAILIKIHHLKSLPKAKKIELKTTYKLF